MLQSINSFFDRWYIGCMALIAPAIIYLNWHAQGMAGLLPNYKYFKTIIQNGFEHANLITFPLWGYGWLMLITESKLGLLTIQMGLALGTLYYFVRCLEQEKIFALSVIRTFKACMIISLPWYAFHALRWPYSIASSLFLVALILFYKAVIYLEKSWLRLLASAICFGVLLNFRSDYLLMPLGFFLLINLFFRTKKVCLQTLIWCFTVYICLIPWALYTKKACDHYLITSTNGGHVMFVGLGHNFHNRWGITPDDADPLMHTLVDEHMQQKNALTCTYEADQFLKQTFFGYIAAYPREYLKKIVHVFRELVWGGCYTGEFFMDEHGEMPLLENTRIRFLLMQILKNPSFMIMRPLDTMRILFMVCSCIMSTLVIFLAYVFIPLTAWYVFCRKQSLFIILMLAAIGYQTLINCFCFHISSYLGNLYVLYLLQAVYGCGLLYGWISKWCRSCNLFRF